MKLKFIEDLEKDADNWHGAIGTKVYGTDRGKFWPKDIELEKMSNREYLKGYLDRTYYKTGRIAEFRIWLEQHVDSSQIQSDLEQLMNRKFGDEIVEVC